MKQRALREWLRFFRSESHILTHNPALLFQQAANQPATTAPAAAALERSRRFASRRWVRWVNRPAHLSPCLLTIPARRGNYLSCDWSPDGRYLLAGSSFSRLTLFDAESGTEVWEIEPFGREVKQCGFSPDGRIVVTIVTSSLLFWEPHTGDPLAGHHQYHPEYSIVSWAFTPDSATLVTGCSDGTLRLWDTSSAEEYRVIDLAGHSSLSSSYNAVEACAVTPDGSRIVAVTPRSIAVVALESATIERYPGGGSEVAGVALLPGDRVLIGERYRGGTRVRSYTGSAGDPDDSDPPLFEIPWLACCAVSPDGKRLLAGCGGSLELWDLDSRRRLAAHSGGGGSIDACRYSPDGARFVSAATVLRTWDSEDFLAAEPAPAAARAIGWARMAPDGKRVVTVGLERIVKLWDAASGAEVPWPGDPAESVSDGRFSADGRRLVAPAGDGTIKLWDLTTGRLLLTLPAQDKRLVDCVLSPDESRILAKTPGESLLLYEARGGRLLLETYGGVGDADLARAFSPDGRRFVMAWAGKLELRDSETGELLHAIPAPPGLRSCCFTPDGTQVQTFAVTAAGSVLCLRDPDTLGEVRSLTAPPWRARTSMQAHREGFCRISPEGRWVLWAGGTSWAELATGRTVATLRRESAQEFSPDGRLLAGYEGNRLLVWSAESGELRFEYPFQGLSGALAWSPDSLGLVTGTANGTVQVLRLEALGTRSDLGEDG